MVRTVFYLHLSKKNIIESVLMILTFGFKKSIYIIKTKYWAKIIDLLYLQCVLYLEET